MKNTNAARTALTKKLANIAAKREACRKAFDVQLEKVWAEHRAKMAKLRADRKAAYEAYDAAVKGAPKAKAKRVSKKAVEAVAEPIVETPVETPEAEAVETATPVAE